MLVFDEHGLIYAYGPLADFRRSLDDMGVREGDFSIPLPHAHHYHQEHDEEILRLLSCWEWRRTELQPDDP